MKLKGYTGFHSPSWAKPKVQRTIWLRKGQPRWFLASSYQLGISSEGMPSVPSSMEPLWASHRTCVPPTAQPTLESATSTTPNFHSLQIPPQLIRPPDRPRKILPHHRSLPPIPVHQKHLHRIHQLPRNPAPVQHIRQYLSTFSRTAPASTNSHLTQDNLPCKD